MYAIIQTGGKQLKVKEGDLIDVELLGLEEGASIQFDTLIVADGKNIEVGQPTVEGYIVEGQVVGHSAGPKIQMMTYRRRQSSRRKKGHRQHYNRVKITGIKSTQGASHGA